MQAWLAELDMNQHAPAFAAANVTGVTLITVCSFSSETACYCSRLFLMGVFNVCGYTLPQGNRSKKLEELGVTNKKDRAILRAGIERQRMCKSVLVRQLFCDSANVCLSPNPSSFLHRSSRSRAVGADNVQTHGLCAVGLGVYAL